MRDEFFDGVYYDGTVGEFYEFEHVGDGVALIDPNDGERVETLSIEEFEEIENDLFQVPEEAIDDPVDYFYTYLGTLVGPAEMDVGFMYADRQTKVVEVEN
jgi:hypothetical protein